MQNELMRTAGLVSRLWLAVFFTSHAVEYVVPVSIFGVNGHAGPWIDTGMAALDVAATGLLAVVALWLILGIYSRITAVIGIVICTSSGALYASMVLTPDRIAAFLAVAILAVTGGGHLCLHAGGWRLPTTL